MVLRATERVGGSLMRSASTDLAVIQSKRTAVNGDSEDGAKRAAAGRP